MTGAGLLLAALAPLVQAVGEFERWHLSFDARIDGEHVIENYPQYEKLFFCDADWARQCGHPLAEWRVVFTDAAGKEVRQAPDWGASYRKVFSAKMRRHDDAFIVPPGGVKATVTFREPGAGDRLVVENLRLEKVADPPTLNVNPDFAFGPWGFAGWSAGRNRRLAPDPDRPGSWMLVAGGNGGGGAAFGDWIPVRPGERIRLAYRMRASLPGRGARVLVMHYKSTAQRIDCWTAEFAKKFGLGDRWSEGMHDFVVPPEATVVRLYAENATIAYARFTRVEED